VLKAGTIVVQGSPASLLYSQSELQVSKVNREKLEAGKIWEQGSPDFLLANQNSRAVKSVSEKQGG
jgi:hypothetical protein